METLQINSNHTIAKPASIRRIKIVYWIATVLLVLLMGAGSIPNILMAPEGVALFTHLGYPVYLLPFLGVAKLSGAIAILVPRFPRLKEWAYAGFTFDLAGAMYSGIAVGDPVSAWAPLFVGFVLIAVSYSLYHSLQAGKK